MADMLIDDVKFTACLDAEADAIRAKTGDSNDIPFDYANDKGFADAIAAIPSGTTITDGIVVKARDSNNNATELDLYINQQSGLLGAFFCGGPNTPPYNTFYRNVTDVTIHGYPTRIGLSAFRNARNLVSISPVDAFKDVTTLEGNAFEGAFGITSLDLPSFTTATSGDVFKNMTGLTSFKAEKCIKPSGGNFTNIFQYDTALQSIQFGSIGYGVYDMNNRVFMGLSQNNLTITMFCKGADVDNILTWSRNGATNATIIIKASEATTYGGNSYAAGDTILTSEVSA